MLSGQAALVMFTVPSPAIGTNAGPQATSQVEPGGSEAQAEASYSHGSSAGGTHGWSSRQPSSTGITSQLSFVSEQYLEAFPEYPSAQDHVPLARS